MNDNIPSGALLNRAAVAGLALGAASTAYLFAVQYLPIDSIFILSSGISSTGTNSFD